MPKIKSKHFNIRIVQHISLLRGHEKMKTSFPKQIYQYVLYYDLKINTRLLHNRGDKCQHWGTSTEVTQVLRLWFYNMIFSMAISQCNSKLNFSWNKQKKIYLYVPEAICFKQFSLCTTTSVVRKHWTNALWRYQQDRANCTDSSVLKMGKVFSKWVSSMECSKRINRFLHLEE